MNGPLSGVVAEKRKRWDAMTKIAGEGARWQCVRAAAKSGDLADDFQFYTPTNDGKFIAVTLQQLWGRWKLDYDKAYNIPDSKVIAVLKAKQGDFTTLDDEPEDGYELQP